MTCASYVKYSDAHKHTLWLPHRVMLYSNDTAGAGVLEVNDEFARRNVAVGDS